ncbi:hypothetical protein [Olsenella sp. Marseille-P4559]|uniref:hypothetical protein n=1 Tax=Olsenella sp. Marseille-P4559 TaxID=2364795 RepID=UPI00103029B1|nr:hypothetical protein [Olsenella sp. Marseille-P4559]
MDPKDQKPDEPPKHSLLVTLLLAAAIALLAGLLAWGVPVLLRMGGHEEEQQGALTVQEDVPEGPSEQVPEP